MSAFGLIRSPDERRRVRPGPDLNTPGDVRDGALDWMGPAHALGVPGARPELVDPDGRGPLLRRGRLPPQTV